MKKFVLILVVIFTSLNLYSQENTPETLFGSEDIKIGGYGGPEVKISSINNEFGLLVGGRGGILINSIFTIGIAGYGVVTNHIVPDYKLPVKGSTDSSANLRVGYGGLHLGFIIEPNKILHLTAGVVIGAGGAAYSSTCIYDWEDREYDGQKLYNQSTFFIIEPQLGAELNLLKFMRLELSASYRYIPSIDLPKTVNTDINGFSGNIMFKFGKF